MSSNNDSSSLSSEYEDDPSSDKDEPGETHARPKKSHLWQAESSYGYTSGRI